MQLNNLLPASTMSTAVKGRWNSALTCEATDLVDVAITDF